MFPGSGHISETFFSIMSVVLHGTHFLHNAHRPIRFSLILILILISILFFKHYCVLYIAAMFLQVYSRYMQTIVKQSKESYEAIQWHYMQWINSHVECCSKHENDNTFNSYKMLSLGWMFLNAHSLVYSSLSLKILIIVTIKLLSENLTLCKKHSFFW